MTTQRRQAPGRPALVGRKQAPAAMLWVTWLLALLLAGAAGTMAACVEQTSAPGGSRDERVVDTVLLAYLSKAKALHVRADIAEDDGDARGAIEALERLLADPAPGGDDPGPEVREVAADTLARVAGLKSSTGDFDGAERDIERGLRLATERTHYRGRLMEVLGTVLQRRYKKLLEDGDEPAAKAVKARALEALEEAVAIQDEVITQALGDGGELLRE